MPSPAGWREVPCVECGDFVPGIDFGDRCGACLRRRLARADRLARRVALGASAVTSAWILLGPAVRALGPWYSMIAIVGTLALVYLIVKRVAMEVLP